MLHSPLGRKTKTDSDKWGAGKGKIDSGREYQQVHLQKGIDLLCRLWYDATLSCSTPTHHVKTTSNVKSIKDFDTPCLVCITETSIKGEDIWIIAIPRAEVLIMLPLKQPTAVVLIPWRNRASYLILNVTLASPSWQQLHVSSSETRSRIPCIAVLFIKLTWNYDKYEFLLQWSCWCGGYRWGCVPNIWEI